MDSDLKLKKSLEDQFIDPEKTHPEITHFLIEIKKYAGFGGHLESHKFDSYLTFTKKIFLYLLTFCEIVSFNKYSHDSRCAKTTTQQAFG